ncbi:MAG: hypothetical protein ACTHLE_11325 [Agriterribacter sp.]
MVKNYLLSLIAILVIFSSCEKLAKLTQFDIKHNTETTIEAGAAANLPFEVSTPEVSTNSQSEFEGNNTNSSLVESVKLKQLKLQITSPSNRNFDFLNDIELYLSADGEEEAKIAWKYDIGDNTGNELTLETGAEELKKYLVKDKYRLRLSITTDKVLNEDIEVKINSVFRVDAKILGL